MNQNIYYGLRLLCLPIAESSAFYYLTQVLGSSGYVILDVSSLGKSYNMILSKVRIRVLFFIFNISYTFMLSSYRTHLLMQEDKVS